MALRKKGDLGPKATTAAVEPEVLLLQSVAALQRLVDNSRPRRPLEQRSALALAKAVLETAIEPGKKENLLAALVKVPEAATALLGQDAPRELYSQVAAVYEATAGALRKLGDEAAAGEMAQAARLFRDVYIR